MTTAHRPTWHPVTGGKDQGGNRVLVQSKQFPSKDLPGHTTLKYRKIGQGDAEEVKKIDFKEELLRRENDQKRKNESENEDQSDAESEVEDSEDDSDESDFSEDELKKELEKIKAERAENERILREKEEKAELKKEEAIRGNPLLDISPGFSLKRKWTEEVIFRNQSRDEPKEKIRFVNDTVRSDFHRKILRKYIL